MVSNSQRLGIVDIGSNALRLLVVEVGSDGNHVVLESRREPVRTGRDVFRTGHIADDTVAAAVAALRGFRAACERHAVLRVRAVATAALREAANREAILQRIRDEVGMDVDVISGEEEARLLVLAVHERVELDTGRSLLVDLGGGSIETVWIDRGSVEAAISHRHGLFRLLPKLTEPGLSGADHLDLLRRHFRELEHEVAPRFRAPLDRYVAVGGNIDAFADLALGPDAKAAGPVAELPMARLQEAVEELADLSLPERWARGLPRDRADTIVAAGWVYLRLGRLARADRILVPRVGLKQALLRQELGRS